MDSRDKLTSRGGHPVHTFHRALSVNARSLFLRRDLDQEPAADTFGDKHLDVFVGVHQGIENKSERCCENANDISDGHTRHDVSAQHIKDRGNCL